MSDLQRRFRLDLLAGGLFVAGLVIALSVFSYDPADPPAPTVFPAHETPANVLGLPGSWLARLLHQTLGIAVYAFLASWFVLVLLLFMRHSVMLWSLRLLGWLLLLPCVAVLAEYVSLQGWGQLPVSGGLLGAWLIAWLEERFQPVGRWLIVAGSAAIGVILTADFVFIAVARTVWQVGRALGGTFSTRKSERPTKKLRADTSTDDIEDDDIPIVRVDKTDEAEPEEEDEAEEVEARPAPTLIPIVRPAPLPETPSFEDYELPALSLLEEPDPFPHEEHDQKLRERAVLLERTFRDFELSVRVVGINTGPVITQYEVALETGLRVNKVTCMADDLALNLKVPSVRIVAPIPGKNTVGVEIPNEHRAVVRLKEVILTAGKKAAKAKIPLFLGKDTEGRPLVYDLAEMPHLLIAGRTGTGKSVCMNSIILSMLMTRRPDEVKMIMIDPKMLELSEYGKIPHLMHPVVKDMKKAEAILAWAVDKMEERYDLLSRVRVRSIAGYNELSPEEIHRRLGPVDEEERARIPDKMPYIVIFVDEMADLMMMMRKEVEGHIIRLAQKSRAAGIHLVVATQKPTVDVITGLIKSNLPARIAFQVASRSDSRVVLDESGADKLLGKGDMLFLQPGTSMLIRAQGTYASDKEIQNVVEALECEPCFVKELVQLNPDGNGKGGMIEALRARDDLYEQAIEIVVREGRGSVSLLQRALSIGYGRAARLIDFMAEDGIVGAYNGSSARDVLYTPEQWEQMKQGGPIATSA